MACGRGVGRAGCVSRGLPALFFVHRSRRQAYGDVDVLPVVCPFLSLPCPQRAIGRDWPRVHMRPHVQLLACVIRGGHARATYGAVAVPRCENVLALEKHKRGGTHSGCEQEGCPGDAADVCS